MNYNCINSRDKNFLSSAYNLKERFRSENFSDKEEFFVIKHLYNQIFNSGKSLALLRICEPKVSRLFEIDKNRNCFSYKLCVYFESIFCVTIETIILKYELI
jgi:hypothetical protein